MLTERISALRLNLLRNVNHDNCAPDFLHGQQSLQGYSETDYGKNQSWSVPKGIFITDKENLVKIVVD